MKDFFEQYEIDQTASLDQKNFGSVYKAIDKNNQQEYAIKISEVHPSFDNGLLQERYTQAQKLEHPNLLPYLAAYRFDEGMINNIAIMPLMKMGSLDHFKDWTNDEKKLIADQVLDGLYYLHAQGIVWQNLSAKHILLDKEFGNEVPKFINYGNTRVIPLNYFADYEYLAPEQLDGSNGVDNRTDIWAYGVLLYSLWTGILPFGEKNANLPNSKIQERILGNWELGLLHKIPEPYQTIAIKCLQRPKEDRWNNCGEIIEQIKNTPLTELLYQETNHSEHSHRILRKPNKPIVWWQVVLLFLLAAVLGWWLGKT